MFRASLFAALAGTALLAAGAAQGAPVRTPHVEAELVAARTAIVPGEPLDVALRLKTIPEWHVYWRNPGDSGDAPRLDWRLPAGFGAGAIEWPVPRRLPVGPLMNFGYEGEVLLLTRVTPPAGLAPGETVTLAAKAWWLVCKVECLPEEGELGLTLPVQAASAQHPQWGGPLAAARAALPASLDALRGWNVAAHSSVNGATLTLAPPGGTELSELSFFPFEQGKIEAAAAQKLVRDEAAYRLQLAAAAQPVGAFDRLAGILVSPTGFGSATPARAVTIDLRIARAPPPASADMGLVAAIALALIGGVILNLMPCVLPVVSIKVLGFAGGGAQRRHGLLYGAGVLVSFWMLAALLAALRAVGENVGWGFQLQSPLVVALLALFFFVLALSFSGALEIGNFLPSGIAGWQSERRSLDAFLSGVLAVMIASPCTAPFMGAALGYGVVAGGGAAFAVFSALGVGMAAPYVLLAWFPGWTARLPRPGPWMVRLRQVLAFPLYGTVVWLAWVLGVQAGLDAIVRLLAAIVVVGAAAWVAGLPRPSARLAGLALAAIATVVALPGERSPAAPARAEIEAAWQPFSTEKVTALTAAGTPVFVDFTAAWCVTCQVNKRLVLSREDVQAAFRARGIELLRADWTRRDAEITGALAALGRSGVPVYVLYRPGRAPLLLPELLTRERVLEALDG